MDVARAAFKSTPLWSQPSRHRPSGVEKIMSSIACSVGLALLAAFGLFTLVRPRVVMSGVGLRVDGGTGMAEVRALLGTTPLALAAWAAYTWSAEAMVAAALLPLGAGWTKCATALVDRDSRRANLVSAAADWTLGGLVLAGAYA